MADIVNIAKFDFDSDRVEKHLKDLQDILFDLSKQQKEVNEQFKNAPAAYEKNNKEISKLSNQLENIVFRWKQGSKVYKDTEEAMKRLRKEGKENTEEFKEQLAIQNKGLEGYKERTSEYQKTLKSIEELKTKNKELENSEQKLFIATKDLQIQRSKVSEEYNKTVAIYKIVLDRNGQLTSSSEALTNALDREVKTREEAKRSTIELNKIKDQLNLNDKEQVKILDVINQKVDKNNKLLKDSGSQNEKLKANIGNYTNSIKEAAEELDIFNGGLLGFIERAQTAGGVGNLLTQTFSKITTATYNLAKSFISLAFTPIGILLTALAGIAYVTKEWYEYNVEISKTDKLIRGIAKTSKEVTSEIRVMATAIQETFGTPLQESVEAAKVLVNEFGITYEEALNQIAEGLIRGQEGNKEYIQSLKEYSTFFAQAGYSVEEFRRIVSAGYDLGMYKDKLPDAIKEFSLSIREQTKSTRDALVNAFGQSFSNELLKGVENGSIGVNEALKKISEEAKKSNLDIQQQAQLTADLFKGAGEDAGGALKIFQAITKSYEDQDRALTDLEKSTARLLEAQRQFGLAKDAALGTDSIIDLRKEFDIFWLRVKRDFYLAITFMKNQLEYGGTLLIVFLETFKQSFGEVVRIINEFDISNPIKSLAEFIGLHKKFRDQVSETTKRIYAQKEATESLKLVEDAVKKVTDENLGRREKNAKDAEAARKKQEALEKAAHDAAMKRIDVEIARQREALDLWILQQGDKARTLQEQLELEQSTSKRSLEILDYELKNKKISQDKYNAELIKLQQKTAKLQSAIAIEVAREEIDRYIESNQTKIKEGKYFSEQTLKQEQERLFEINKREQESNALRKYLGEINEKEFIAIKKGLDKKYEEDKSALEIKYSAQRFEQLKLQQAIQFQQKLLDLEIQGSSENRILKEKEDQRFQAELLTFLEQNKIKADIDNDNYISAQELKALRDETQRNYELAKNEEEKVIYQTQLDQIDVMTAQSAKNRQDIETALFKTKIDYAQRGLDAVGQVAGKDTAAAKAVGIAKVGIDTSMAIMKSYSDLGPIGGTIFAAIVGTLGAININKIASTKEPKINTKIDGYATGGVITDGFGIKRNNGDNVLITAKTGEAILNQQQQSFIGRDVLSLAGVPGFATGGLVGTKPSSLASVQNSLFSQIDFTALTEAVRQGALEGSQQGSLVGSQQGTTVGSQQGISQLSSSRVVQGNSVR